MKLWFSLLLVASQSILAQTEDFSSYPVYSGNDLGLTYSPSNSFFRIWAPTASKAELFLFKNNQEVVPQSKIDMVKDDGGTWTALVATNLAGRFYTFRVLINGKWSDEVPDPYTKLMGVNSKRAMIGDLNQTDPPGWNMDISPGFNSKTDAIIYELHIRDLSIHNSSGVHNKGKYLGLSETGTKNKAGLSTGLDHIRQLGVTHVHLLPFYDFFTVDETKLNQPQYNWGYDPMNYNSPEGSYSTNPYDGAVRVKELKTMIHAMHRNGLRVVMDVVFNHTMFAEKSHLNQLVPGYYYRQKADGSFSDATACGNETASERPMMRKLMLESLRYWVEEFHIDGFRFDLMGVHDIETMNLISKELHKIKPSILLYGEGWTAGGSPLADSLRALKKTAHVLDRIAVFSDDLRDGIKGSVFDHQDKGFVSGKQGMEESIKFGVVAALQHPQVDYSQVNYSKAPYANTPHQTISYSECHDNHVLWDKLAISGKKYTEKQRIDMHKLALSIVLSSQGISFLHAGTEFLRSKQGVENSYNAGDSINAIDWNLKTKNLEIYNYVKTLIKMRKEHPAFRLKTKEAVESNISFLQMPTGIVAYKLKGAAVGDKWKQIIVIYNGNIENSLVDLPGGTWKTFISSNQVSKIPKSISKDILVSASSCTILYQN